MAVFSVAVFFNAALYRSNKTYISMNVDCASRFSSLKAKGCPNGRKSIEKSMVYSGVF